MRFRSDGETDIISSYSRAARLDRLRRKWLLPWRVRTSFPDPVYSKRRAAALWVFNFGIEGTSRQVYHTPCEPQPHNEMRVAQPERTGVRHLRVAVLSNAQRDRHLGHPKPGAMRFHCSFELDAEAVLFE